MPHLQFDLSFTPRPEAKTRFAKAVVGHDGPDFQMHDGVLPSWSAGEKPLQGLR